MNVGCGMDIGIGMSMGFFVIKNIFTPIVSLTSFTKAKYPLGYAFATLVTPHPA
jgi:hypothetical protein